VNKLRSWLYFVAALLGDVQAVASGRVAERLLRRVVWREVTRMLKRL
jgi:hypothetical protein